MFKTIDNIISFKIKPNWTTLANELNKDYFQLIDEKGHLGKLNSSQREQLDNLYKLENKIRKDQSDVLDMLDQEYKICLSKQSLSGECLNCGIILDKIKFVKEDFNNAPKSWPPKNYDFFRKVEIGSGDF